MLTAAGVRLEEWVRFAIPVFVILFALGALGVAVGVAAGL
jgi:hypothetical protein